MWFKKNRFKVGDWVEVVTRYEGCPAGEVGRVFEKGLRYCYIDFGRKTSFGHTCGGDLPGRTGYCVDYTHLKKVKISKFETKVRAYIDRELGR